MLPNYEICTTQSASAGQALYYHLPVGLGTLEVLLISDFERRKIVSGRIEATL